MKKTFKNIGQVEMTRLDEKATKATFEGGTLYLIDNGDSVAIVSDRAPGCANIFYNAECCDPEQDLLDFLAECGYESDEAEEITEALIKGVSKNGKEEIK